MSTYTVETGLEAIRDTSSDARSRALADSMLAALKVDETTRVSTKLLDDVITELDELVSEAGDDHSVGICSCKPRELAHALKLLRGDPAAIEEQRREDAFLAELEREQARVR